MDISGLIQSYDSRAASSAALTRTIIAPHYIPTHNFSGANSNALVAPHQQIQQHNPFGFGAYTAGGPNQIIPAFAANNYIQQRPLPRLMQPENDGRGMPFSRNPRQGYIEEHHSRSPPIKSEPQWNVSSNSPSFVASNSKNLSPTAGVNGSNDTNFGTEVDTLMKAIQAKAQSAPPQKTPSGDQSRPVDDAGSAKGGKKRYQCTIENCTKSFYQKTHLDIHERAHTGVKPYPCKEPDCGRSFSQLGNLKTHERRHTGERPYTCEICGKRFAQRGNVRAHKIVHDQSKPYLCRLDECGKQFTQLGNLKSHQNKFHIATIRTLTSKFASIKDGDLVHAADKELWEYFANLYKNSNKGIKGRGKDRKVGSNSMLSSGMRNLGVGGRGGGGYNMSSSGKGNMISTMGANMGAHGAGRGEGGQYDMFDVDTESQGSHSGASSVGTCYDDAPSDGFEDTGRSNDLAFGDRIY